MDSRAKILPGNFGKAEEVEEPLTSQQMIEALIEENRQLCEELARKNALLNDHRYLTTRALALRNGLATPLVTALVGGAILMALAIATPVGDHLAALRHQVDQQQTTLATQIHTTGDPGSRSVPPAAGHAGPAPQIVGASTPADTPSATASPVRHAHCAAVSECAESSLPRGLAKPRLPMPTRNLPKL